MSADIQRMATATAAILTLSGGSALDASAQQPSESRIATAPQTARASITARAPDEFYEPPAELPAAPGTLLRSEPLRGVTLPNGMQAWRILYTTTVDDRTPATAVATVFAPADCPGGALPVIAWEHGTVGLVQKCMPSLLSAPTEGIPARDQIVAEGWVVAATDYSFTETSEPRPYIIGEGEARAGSTRSAPRGKCRSSISTSARSCGAIRRAGMPRFGPASSPSATQPMWKSSA